MDVCVCISVAVTIDIIINHNIITITTWARGLAEGRRPASARTQGPARTHPRPPCRRLPRARQTDPHPGQGRRLLVPVAAFRWAPGGRHAEEPAGVGVQVVGGLDGPEPPGGLGPVVGGVGGLHAPAGQEAPRRHDHAVSDGGSAVPTPGLYVCILIVASSEFRGLILLRDTIDMD